MHRARQALWTVWLLALLPATGSAGTWYAGGRAGLNVADLHGGLNTMTTRGVHAGAFVEHAFSSRFALDLELLYSAKGAEIYAPVFDDFGKIIGREIDRFRFHYLEVPALAAVSLPLSRVVRARMLAGPVVGLSLGGRFERNSDPSRSRDLEDVRAIDVGVAGGAGLGIATPAYEVSVDARYTAGLLNSFDFGSAGEMTHRVISVGMAVKWRFPRPQKG